MPIGIRPLNDFAFKKTFGSPENKSVLVSLLNSILSLRSPITDVTIENPYNERDFQEDKLSIVDVKATDNLGARYNVEVQLSTFPGLVSRLVYYGCELFADQLRAGQDYAELRPAFSICLVKGFLWRDTARVHHAFELVDRRTGRTLDGALSIHTLELGRYNTVEAELANASLLDCWLYWLIHADRYERDELHRLFPHASIRQATETITRIAEVSEDKLMYDAREKAQRDHDWALKQSFREGESVGMAKGEAVGVVKGKIELIRTLQQILNEPVSEESELSQLDVARLQEIAAGLQLRIRARPS